MDGRSRVSRGSRRSGRRVAGLLLLSATAALVAVPGAHAATVAVILGTTTHTMSYQAAPGEINDVEVLQGTGDSLLFREAGTAPLTAGAACTQLDPQRASCSTAGVDRVSIDVADGNDRVRLGASHGGGSLPAPCCTVVGGAGNDTLDGSFVTNVGLALTGQTDADTLIGGAGNDVLRGGPGPDAMSGLGGIDEVSYDDHTAGVSATLDGAANDGAPGVDGFGIGFTGGDAIAADVEGLTARQG